MHKNVLMTASGMRITHLYYRDADTRNDYAYPQPCWKRIPVESVTAKHVLVACGGSTHKLTRSGLKKGFLYSASARRMFFLEPNRLESQEVWNYTEADGWVLDGGASAAKWYAKRASNERDPEWLEARIWLHQYALSRYRPSQFSSPFLARMRKEHLQDDLARYEALLSNISAHQGAAA